MSTNKTQNYQLHAWAPEDEHLRTELNANFTKLDAALKVEETARANAVTTVDAKVPQVVFGTYMGAKGENDSTVVKITLGKRPKVVIVTAEEGFSIGSGRYFSAMAGPGHPASTTGLKLAADGFSVSNTSFLLLNCSGYRYHYMALL